MTDNEGCSATLIYTGMTASCNSGPRARATQSFDSGVEGAKLKAKKKQKQKGRKIVVKLKAGAAEAVTVEASGRIKVGKKTYALKNLTRSVGANATATLKMKLKKPGDSRKVVKALGGKVKATITGKFTDAAAGVVTKKAVVKLK